MEGSEGPDGADDPATDAERSSAEDTDAERLGEDIGQPDLPGTVDFPPDHPVGVEDPTMLEGTSGSDDDLETRDWRTEPDDARHEEPGLRTTEPAADSGADDEAVAGELTEDEPGLSAEEQAVHRRGGSTST